MGPDIGPILDQWPYESGQITVRKIRGADGREKVQLRLDLGLLQMELKGRPDGRRPYGRSSVLEHVEHELNEHRRRAGSDQGFALSDQLSRELRDEALMCYHRYLSLFVLEDYEGVARDTANNLRILDLINRYGPTAGDRMMLEQYRPYVTMMNTRARAQQAIVRGDYRRAMAMINSGLGAIRDFFHSIGHAELFRQSNEAAVLHELRKEVAGKLPKDPLRLMERRLAVAVKAERYEEAAKLRDRIERLRRTRKVPRSRSTSES